jgi:hypothetical protein
MNRLGPLLLLLGLPILGGAARQTAIPVEFIGDWSSSIERCALGPADNANIRIGPRVIQEFGTRLDVRYVVKQGTSGLFVDGHLTVAGSRERSHTATRLELLDGGTMLSLGEGEDSGRYMRCKP